MPSDTPRPAPFSETLAVAALTRDRPAEVTRRLDPAEGTALAAFLGIEGVPELAFAGRLAPEGADGWRLTGRLEGRAVQHCVVTLDPVEEEIAAEIDIAFAPAAVETPPETLEIGPEDLDAPEPLGEEIDVAAAMIEALALALDPYPRATGSDPVQALHAAPGVEPLTDADMRPFAGLAALRARMANGTGSGD